MTNLDLDALEDVGELASFKNKPTFSQALVDDDVDTDELGFATFLLPATGDDKKDIHCVPYVLGPAVDDEDSIIEDEYFAGVFIPQVGLDDGSMNWVHAGIWDKSGAKPKCINIQNQALPKITFGEGSCVYSPARGLYPLCFLNVVVDTGGDVADDGGGDYDV